MVRTRASSKNSEKNTDVNANTLQQISRRKRRVKKRPSVIKWCAKTTMGNSQTYDLTPLSQEATALPNPLCVSCLYPCSSSTDSDSPICTNKLCPVVSLLLNCEVVSDPKSKVSGCPVFRGCPKCHSLIMHGTGCKFVTCKACNHRFCFICLQNSEDCRKDRDKYWSLTCNKPRAERQRFTSPQS